MSWLAHFAHGLDQHFDTLLLAQAIDRKDQWEVGRKMQPLSEGLVARAGAETFEIDAVGDRTGGSPQAVFVEQVERCSGGGSDVLAAVAKMDQIGIAGIAE